MMHGKKTRTQERENKNCEEKERGFPRVVSDVVRLGEVTRLVQKARTSPRTKKQEALRVCFVDGFVLAFFKRTGNIGGTHNTHNYATGLGHIREQPVSTPTGIKAGVD
jgi:hypothetical protein